MPIEKLRPSFSFDEERIKQLKQIAPEAFADNQVNWEVLKEALGNYLEEDDVDVEHFGLFWPGKREARRMASIPSKGTLIPCPGEGIDEENTRNIFIEGENLEVLKILQKSYAGRIKMIYIDPPYNTGNDFVYDDNFTEPLEEYLRRTRQIDEEGKPLTTNKKSDGRFHSKWLSMMYPRLRLARNLLRDDGSIFISINDVELFNLRQILNEIFGEENFVGCMIWRKKEGGGQTDEFFVTEHEYVIVYRKSESFSWEDKEEELNDSGFPLEDESGKYKLIKLAKWGSAARKEDRPTMHFPIQAPDGKNVLPKAPDGSLGRWRVGKARMNDLVKSKLIHWENRSGQWIPYEKLYQANKSHKIIKTRSILYDIAGTGDGTNELTDLFGYKDVFDNPKPTNLIKSFLQYNTSYDDIILDFFAGSGTTAQAIFNANIEDNQTRRFILVQFQEETKDNSVAKKNKIDLISGIAKKRIKLASKRLSSKKGKTDLGFKVLCLNKSNIKNWQLFEKSNVSELEDLFGKFESVLIDDWKEENLLVEVLLLEGFPIDSKIDELKEYYKNKVFSVLSDFSAYKLLICLDKKVHSDTIQNLQLGDNDIFICLDNAITDEEKVTLADKGLIKTI